MPSLDSLEAQTGDNPQATIIILHGLGADGTDFVPVAEQLDLRAIGDVRYVFPNAPEIPVTINGGYVMPAWYDIIALGGESREIDEAGLLAARAIVRALIAREVERGIPSERIFLAGFSQGGAVAYLSALTHPEPLAGVIALSTYIPSAALITRELSAANRDIPMFVAHGTQDDVVPPAMGQQALELLRGFGLAPQWHTYPMPHSVCPQEIDDIGAWLRMRLSALPELPG